MSHKLDHKSDYMRTGRNIKVTREDLLNAVFSRLEQCDQLQKKGRKLAPCPYEEIIIVQLPSGKTIAVPKDIQEEAIKIWIGNIPQAHTRLRKNARYTRDDPFIMDPSLHNSPGHGHRHYQHGGYHESHDHGESHGEHHGEHHGESHGESRGMEHFLSDDEESIVSGVESNATMNSVEAPYIEDDQEGYIGNEDETGSDTERFDTYSSCRSCSSKPMHNTLLSKSRHNRHRSHDFDDEPTDLDYDYDDLDHFSGEMSEMSEGEHKLRHLHHPHHPQHPHHPHHPHHGHSHHNKDDSTIFTYTNLLYLIIIVLLIIIIANYKNRFANNQFN